ncbi:MAG: hypothetical protein RL684_1508 [Pseudomonadota bacterium]|jgi:hypothetical protein
MSMTGTCLCGAVRYESSAEPVFSGHCHCVDCQKETGGGHLTIAAVPNDSVTVSGPVTTFRNNGGSGQPVERVFCSVCGTTVFARPTVFGSVTMLRAGTLDDHSKVVPGMSIFTSHARAWDPPSPAIPGFPHLPPRS